MILYVQNFFKTLLCFVSLRYFNYGCKLSDLDEAYEKQRLVDHYNNFTNHGFDTSAIAIVPFRIRVQVAKYKLQLSDFYEKHPDCGIPRDYILPLPSEHETRLSRHLEISDALTSQVPLQEHATNLSKLLTTAYTHSGYFFTEACGYGYVVKPYIVLSAAMIDVVLDDVATSTAVDTIIGGFQGAFIFFEAGLAYDELTHTLYRGMVVKNTYMTIP